MLKKSCARHFLFLLVAMFCLLIAGIVKTNAQTWTPPVFHEGDIYIDPNCKASNCLDGMEVAIQQQLQILKAAPCGKTINVIVLNEDCPPVKAEKLGDNQWILKGPDMPLQGNPAASMNGTRNPPRHASMWNPILLRLASAASAGKSSMIP